MSYLDCRQNPKLARALAALVKCETAEDLRTLDARVPDVMVSQDRFAVYRATILDDSVDGIDGSQFSTGKNRVISSSTGVILTCRFAHATHEQGSETSIWTSTLGGGWSHPRTCCEAWRRCSTRVVRLSLLWLVLVLGRALQAPGVAQAVAAVEAVKAVMVVQGVIKVELQ